MNSRKIYFFRHGLTDWNQQRRLQGHTDIPLNEEGRRQAESLQEFFQKNPVDKVFSSDLGRAVETASLATGTSQDQIILNKGLREAHLGVIEGLSENEIIAKFGEDHLHRWRSLEIEHLHETFPGAESRDDCNKRLQQTLLEICGKEKFENAAICSHGFVMRRLFHHLSGGKIPPLIANCVIYEIHFSEDSGQFQVILPFPEMK